MADGSRLELRGPLDNLRPDVVRVLVPIGGERAERLELAHRPEPAANVRAVKAAPRFDRPGEMGSPEERGGERREELVVLPVVQLDEAVQPANRRRRRDAGGGKARAK